MIPKNSYSQEFKEFKVLMVLISKELEANSLRGQEVTEPRTH